VLKKTLPAFFSQNMQDTDDPLYSHRIRWSNTAKGKFFFSEAVKKNIGDYSGLDELINVLPPDFSRFDNLGKAQFLEIDVFLGNYLLSSQGDRVAMAHSIEIRLPFLDHRLLEFAGRIPSLWKILGMSEKHILKKSFKGILPESIISRVKHPYRAPIHHSLLHTKSGEYHRTLLNEKCIDDFGMFNGKMVSQLVTKLMRPNAASEVDGMTLTGILSAQIIHQKFIENFRSIDVPLANLHVLIDKRASR
jgi:asparagine synthase (glutamine-hydrolysing)